MAAWTDLYMLRENATTTSVLRELATCFTGSLRDWFDTLGEYRQLQFVQLLNVSSALSVIHGQFNDPTLKHVFLASLPAELQPDIQRQLTSLNLTIDTISLEKIFQIAKGCFKKLCEQKQFFKELLKDKEPF